MKDDSYGINLLLRGLNTGQYAHHQATASNLPLSCPPIERLIKATPFAWQLFGKILSRKTLLVMKLTIALMLMACFQVNARGYGQKLSLSVKDTPLEKVLQEIHKKTKYNFLYNVFVMEKAEPVTVDLKNAPLAEVLAQCFRNQLLSYIIVENTIIIKPAQPVVAQQQTAMMKDTVIGKVVDEKGEPLAGVSVTVRGTSKGTTTNTDGSFSLAADKQSTVEFSMVGFGKYSVKLNSNGTLRVVLVPEASDLNATVVVGYAVQKKINLTGSVATVSGEELTKNTSPNAANLLSGKIAGLDVIQNTGTPGGDAPNLTIRGLGSFGASSVPLILIDGVLGDINLVNANDIESVSVLKDAASAAIYGSRAANGVILVTTKRGKAGDFHIDYNNIFSTEKATRLPKLVWNSVQYMQMYNQANEHNGNPDVYTQAQIDAYKNAAPGDPNYPNFNWINYYFKNAFSQTHNLAFSGGNDKTTYNVSLGYLGQNGVIKNNDYKRYNMLFNLDSRINKVFKFGTSVSFTQQHIIAPWLSNSDLVLLIYQAAPTYAPFLPDGSGRLAVTDYAGNTVHNRSPEFVLDNGNIVTNNYQARGQAYVEANIAPGLTWMVKGAFTYTDGFNKQHQYGGAEYAYHPDTSGNYTLLDNGNPSLSGVLDQDDRQILLNVYSTLNYQKDFAKDHHFNILAGTSVESFRDDQLQAYRGGFVSPIPVEIVAGSSSNQATYGQAYEWALRSYFGRINYNYKGKYLLELNGDYEGSSRIDKQNRYGFFPSVSAGWIMSEENFMKPINWITNLKLRGSRGELGNQLIGGNYPYAYQNIASIGSYPFASGTEQGTQLTRLIDPSLKWETTNITDIGIDANLGHGLFTATIDWYNKVTSGILTKPVIPESIGLSAPTTNFGTLQNKGWEFNIGHNNKIGKDFRYGVNLMVSTYKNKLLKISKTQDRGMYIDSVGLPYDSYYLIKWVGIFNTQDEIDKSPVQQNTPQPGDLKYGDANGDNKVDSKDRVIIKGNYPAYTYSFNLNVGYKNWDLSAFFQGVQGVKQYVFYWGVDPFIQGGTPPTYFQNAWTPQNHSQTIPALYSWYYPPTDGTSSTYFLQDASYLRLKNVQLTYTLPPALVQKMKLKGLSLFVSGNNLATFTKYRGADPERTQPNQQYGSTRFAQYPQIRILSGGLHLKF